MNKLLVFVLALLVVAPTAFAVAEQPRVEHNINSCPGNVIVRAQDTQGNNLEGVLVAPEWKLLGGWNDFIPQDAVTNSEGEADHCKWFALRRTSLQINYAEIEGYTCTRGESTRITATNRENTLVTVCTPLEHEIPEFGVVAFGLVGVLAAGLVVARKN